MTVAWSFYASGQLEELLRTIAVNLSYEDALRWNDKIHDDLERIAANPFLGHPARHESFITEPLLIGRLRETFCGNFRIIYEPIDEVCRVLSITHTRQLVSGERMVWDR